MRNMPTPAMSDNVYIGFSTILASSIHDMKNSLGVVLNSLDELLGGVDAAPPSSRLAKLRWEAQRVNDNLVQLLALYKMENQGLALNIDEYPVRDFIQEVLASEKAALETRNIEIGLQCPRDLVWYFDRDLSAGVLKNALNNALRYATTKVLIAAEEADHCLVLSVNDDGKGFPESVIADGRQHGHGVNFSSGNTGLGLYFTSRVAELHKNKGRQGAIELGNGGVLGGACFSIKLP
jgi:two-component system, OmpR family, sensor histidine kinase SenX3